MAVNRTPWRRGAVPLTGVAAWLTIAAAAVAAQPVVPVGPPSGCTESRSAPAECGGGNADRKPVAPAPQLPLQMLAPPPARSAPSPNPPAGALVPPAPGPARDTPIVAVP